MGFASLSAPGFTLTMHLHPFRTVRCRCYKSTVALKGLEKYLWPHDGDDDDDEHEDDEDGKMVIFSIWIVLNAVFHAFLDHQF